MPLSKAAFSVIFATAALGSGGSRAQSVGDHITTTDGAVVCLEPTKVFEAFQAILANDANWLRSLDCATVRGGVPAILIEVETEVYGIWKVRLRPPNADGVTMDGLRCVFNDPKTNKTFCEE